MTQSNEAHGDLRATILTTLLDRSDEHIALLDDAGRILFVNAIAARATGFSSPEEAIGRSWIELWPDETRAEVQSAIATAHGGEIGRTRALRAGHHGERSWWDITVRPVAGDANDSRPVLVVARDVTVEVDRYERVAAVAAEMRHRLANAWIVASGLVHLSARSRPELKDFAQSVADRFVQLSRAQDLILNPSADRDFARIVPLLSSAYGDGSLLEFGTLPDVRLGDSAMQALALTFGELATNSLKYGALKNGRTIAIDGEAQQGMMHFEWREPTDFGPGREGSQGLGLITRLIEASGGAFTYRHDPNLYTARITLPILG